MKSFDNINPKKIYKKDLTLLKIFGITAFITAIPYAIIIIQNKVPFAHDTYQYLQLQYIYFNEVVQKHSIPLWFPFMTHGITGNFIYIPQLNILTPVYYLIGLFFKEINYLYLFYVLMWVEELFFLFGVILLASIYYKDRRAILFVSVVLLGSVIWYPQVWWNFHLYYFLPIVLYSIHMCLITGRFRYLMFSLLFFSLSIYSNFIYCMLFASFVVACYAIFLISIDFRNFKSFLGKNLDLRKIALALFIFFVIAVSFYYIKYGSGEISFLGADRESSGRISLKTFLTYGGSLGIGKYKDIFFRHAGPGDISQDINLFAGILLVPFIIFSLMHVRKNISYVVLCVSVIVFLFSIGSFVSKLFYYVYPLGNMFRHIGLTATAFKLFAVFYAGFGFEEFLRRIKISKISIIGIIIYSCIATYLILKCSAPINTEHFWYVSEVEIFLIESFYLASAIGTIIIFILMFLSKGKKEYLVNALLILIILDLFSYKYALVVSRMPSASDEVIGLFKPFSYSFPSKRIDWEDVNLNTNERIKAFTSVDFKYSQYNTNDTFFYADFFSSKYRTDFMGASVKKYFDFMNAFPNELSGAYVYRKYSGSASYPKIGVFSRLNVLEREEDIGKIFSQGKFTGDMLFTTAEEIRKIDIEDSANRELIVRPNVYKFYNMNERNTASIKVEEFSFNMLKLKVLAEGRLGGYGFLYYSDAYHPHWNAYVNGKKTPVIKANIGYKSVRIPYGSSEVVFTFGNFYYYISILSTMITLSAILLSAVYLFKSELLSPVSVPYTSLSEEGRG